MSSRNKIFALFAIILLYFSDQATKFLAVKNLVSGESIPIIKNHLHITLVFNSGAAFGLLRATPHLFEVIAIVAVFLINFLLLRKSHALVPAEKISLCLILAGTLGNLTDRIRLGYVVDFIDFRVWPVFNFADCFITVGAIMLGLSILGFFRGGRINA
jgi:signal peptidase II